jgi:murein DD-endopeptidase MepM/ murein hydrolase activator NlpD
MRVTTAIATTFLMVTGLLTAGQIPMAAQESRSQKPSQTVNKAVNEVRIESGKKKKNRGKACPTKNFWVGSGWGADRGRRSHMGMDLGGKRGTPIFAVETGRINRTKKQSNGSIQIVLRGKSGSMYYYGHLDSVLIKSGQRVKSGQVIGRMGDTGSPGQVHLHFEYWRSGGESDAINPIKLLRRICKGI